MSSSTGNAEPNGSPNTTPTTNTTPTSTPPPEQSPMSPPQVMQIPPIQFTFLPSWRRALSFNPPTFCGTFYCTGSSSSRPDAELSIRKRGREYPNYPHLPTILDDQGFGKGKEVEVEQKKKVYVLDPPAVEGAKEASDAKEHMGSFEEATPSETETELDTDSETETETESDTESETESE